MVVGPEDEVVLEDVDCSVEVDPADFAVLVGVLLVVDDLDPEAVCEPEAVDDPDCEAVCEPEDEFVVDAEIEPLTLPVEDEISFEDQVMYGSVSSAIASARTDCCTLYQDAGASARNTSKLGVAVASASSVVADPVSDAEQAVTVEHESVMVDVDAVLAPEGVKMEYDVSQALAVCAEQELLDPLDVDCEFVDCEFVAEAEFVGWLVGSVES